MTDKKISELSAAGSLTGDEIAVLVKAGVTVQTTAQAIADLGGGGNWWETVVPNYINPVAATGLLTLAVQPTALDTFGPYTFVVAGSVFGDIELGADLDATKANLIQQQSEWWDATVSDFAISAFSGDDAVLTARSPGTAGNSISIATAFASGSNLTNAATLSGGIDSNDAAPMQRNKTDDANIKLPYLDDEDHTVLVSGTNKMTWLIDHTNDWFGRGSLVGLRGESNGLALVFSGADELDNANAHPRIVVSLQATAASSDMEFRSENATDSSGFINSPGFTFSGSEWDGGPVARQVALEVAQSEFGYRTHRLDFSEPLRSVYGVILENEDFLSAGVGGILSPNGADSAYIRMLYQKGDLTHIGGALALDTVPTSDPNVAGEVYSMDAAGLAAELAAGSRYLLVSNGP